MKGRGIKMVKKQKINEREKLASGEKREREKDKE